MYSQKEYTEFFGIVQVYFKKEQTVQTGKVWVNDPFLEQLSVSFSNCQSYEFVPYANLRSTMEHPEPTTPKVNNDDDNDDNDDDDDDDDEPLRPPAPGMPAPGMPAPGMPAPAVAPKRKLPIATEIDMASLIEVFFDNIKTAN